MFNIGVYITAITAYISGIIWAIRLEGKVSQHDQLFAERKAQSDERQVAALARHTELKEDVKERLTSIEQKLDSLVYKAALPPKG